ncbi:hypothetical protein TNCV_4210991 [Trichonephila clavipes]|nr:hypothetical protein TNCV_4210991 [Trichonephila clavipes]
MARRNHLDDFTWKNDRKAGGGRTVTSVSCSVRNQQKCRLRALKAFQTTGTAVLERLVVAARTTTAGDDRYIILRGGG